MPQRLFIVLSSLILGGFLLALVPVAWAAPDARAEGAPALNHDSPTGYYIWHNDDGFHLRTHGPSDDHDFVAYLRTNGTFENVDPVKLEGDQHDRVEILNGGHVLAVHFHTYDATDGVNFTVRGGEHLRFNLRLDDKPAPVAQIFLGDEGRHPENNPFSIER